MAKVKYYYDTNTLSYKRIELSTIQKVKKGFFFTISSTIFAVLIISSYLYFFDSPKEKRLKQENQFLSNNYNDLQQKISKIEDVMEDMQIRDDNIYRVIFEADPIPNSIRKAGFGGINRYEKYRGYNTTELVTNTAKKIDQISKQIYIQSKSFDHIIELAKNKSKMLAAIPAIQPIENKDLKRIASGYGYRIHPIYKIRKMHYGIDFTAKTGTPIYATGNGEVEKVSYERGYGYHVVVNHGYGYKTLYAHMRNLKISKVNDKGEKIITKIKKGDKVKRGDIIGHVGNTGVSSGPHLHYEVIKNGVKINPVNYFFNDLSPKQFEEILNLASQKNQSFD